MDKFRISGGRTLSGTVKISGAKNAALPLMAAALLTDETVTLCNIPMVRDVFTMFRLLEQIGVNIDRTGDNSVRLRAESIRSHKAPYELVKTMRASILSLGALMGREGRAKVSLPGGCAIGDRPVNLHIDGLRKLGARIDLDHGYIDAEAEELKGEEIYFDTRTVTGTENMMMAAGLASGTTTLLNAACEPEIVDLADMLNRMGAKIEGAGTNTITVEGVGRLRGVEHRVIPDRIETGTFVIAGCLVGDGMRITGCVPEHIEALLDKLKDAGADLRIGDGSITASNGEGLEARDIITRPFPGFPTDMQAQYMVLMTRARGSAVINETIFENRFMHVPELKRMGADIKTDGGKAVVTGGTKLTGAKVMATDLRASACLLLAGLAAEGETVIDRVYHIDRGYENIEKKLRTLGAGIERINE